MHRSERLTSSLQTPVEARHQMLKVRLIQFTQSTVSEHFQDGKSIATSVDFLVRNETNPREIPLIRVVNVKGVWFSLDNRRLRVFKDAFVDEIPVIVCSFEDPCIKREFYEKRNNTTIDGGGIIRIAATPTFTAEHFDQGIYTFTKEML